MSLEDRDVVRLLDELAWEEKATVNEPVLRNSLVEAQPFLSRLGIREQGNLVALAIYCNSLSITDRDQLAYSVDLLDLVVTNAHRRKGYGSSLMEKLQECSLGQERDTIRWSLFEDNLAAKSFYKFLEPKQRNGNKVFFFPTEGNEIPGSSPVNWMETLFDFGLKLRLENRKEDWIEAIIFPSFDASLPGAVGEIGMVSYSCPQALSQLSEAFWNRIAESSTQHWNAKYLTWYEPVLPQELVPNGAQITDKAVHFSSKVESFGE